MAAKLAKIIDLAVHQPSLSTATHFEFGLTLILHIIQYGCSENFNTVALGHGKVLIFLIHHVWIFAVAQ